MGYQYKQDLHIINPWWELSCLAVAREGRAAENTRERARSQGSNRDAYSCFVNAIQGRAKDSMACCKMQKLQVSTGTVCAVYTRMHAYLVV